MNWRGVWAAAFVTLATSAGATAVAAPPAGSASSSGSGALQDRAAMRERILRSIVGVRVSRHEPKLSFKGRFKVTADISNIEGTGSGVVVDASGLILTCAHVLGAQNRAEITLPDGRMGTATLVVADPATDLAILKVPGARLEPLDLRRAPKLRQGSIVFLASRPGGDTARFSEETLAAEGAFHAGHSDLEFLRQFLGDIEPGDSGGALVDEEGRLVGVLSSGVPQGRVGYAIARELVMLALSRMRAGAPVVWPWLGAGVESHPDGPGVRVWTVARGSPAEVAGIRAGDRIVALDGHPLEHFLPAMMAVIARPIGTSFRVSIQRPGDREEDRASVLPVVSALRPLEPDLRVFDVLDKLTGIRLGVETIAPGAGTRVVVLADAAGGGRESAGSELGAPHENGAAVSARGFVDGGAPPSHGGAAERGGSQGSRGSAGRGEVRAPGDGFDRRPVGAGSRLVSVLPGLGVVRSLEEGRNDQEIPIANAEDLAQAMRAATIGNSMTAVFTWSNEGRRESMLLSGEARRLPIL